MKKYSLLFLFVFISSEIFAAGGGIKGKVLDTNQLPLAGANIIIENLTIGTVSNLNGEFILWNIPEGDIKVKVSYIGYETKYVDIVLLENKMSVVDIELSPGVIVGDEILVVGDRLQGQAKALNQQKTNYNITNIVSSEQVGKFPDANIGDALKRIPSITVNYDEGEARFANIRGLEPRLNSVMINGERIPSAEGDARAVQLDLISSDVIQNIEVSKTITPDMEGDAIGGAVNLVTRQAPNNLRFSSTLGSGFNFLSERPIWTASGIGAQRFFDDKLGLVVNGSYHNHHLAADNMEAIWDLGTNGYYLTEQQVRKYDIIRIRRNVSAALDYKLGEHSVLYLNALYSHRDDLENRARITLKTIGEPGINDTVSVAEIRRQTKGGINNDRNENRRLEDQRIYSLSFSGEHWLPELMKIDWAVGLAKASEERPNERYIDWRVRNVNFIADLSNPRTPYFTPVDENAVRYGAFALREITEQRQFTEENDNNFRLNFEIPISKTNYSNSIKFGLKYRVKEKKRDNNYFRYQPRSGFDSLLVTQTKDYTDEKFLAGNYKIGYFTTYEYLGSLNLQDTSLFDRIDDPSEYITSNYDAKEKVFGGYAMLNYNIGENIFVIAGLRVENTRLDYSGFELIDSSLAVSKTLGNGNYTNWMPSVHVRYKYDENTILRFAWTNTLARPNYYSLVPYRLIDKDNGSDILELGNPELNSTKSMNFDLIAEYYYETIGILSLGFFYKNIDDFIYVSSENNYFDPVSGNVFDKLIQPRNGADANLFGFEIAYQRQLNFLPGFLKNLGLYSNYTYTYSTTDNPEFEKNKIKLPGTAEHTLNLGLLYQEKDLSVTVSFNYTSPYIDPYEVDLTPGLERYYDRVTYLDISGSYSFTEQFRFFFEANNLLNQPLRYYAGSSDRTMQAEYYDSRFTAGIKFDL